MADKYIKMEYSNISFEVYKQLYPIEFSFPLPQLNIHKDSTQTLQIFIGGPNPLGIALSQTIVFLNQQGIQPSSPARLILKSEAPMRTGPDRQAEISINAQAKALK